MKRCQVFFLDTFQQNVTSHVILCLTFYFCKSYLQKNLLNGIPNLKVESGNNVKNRIKELRKEKRITQAKLVENIGISRQYISLLEKNEIEPSMRVANKIARALNACIYTVFDLDGEKTYKCPNCSCG